MRDKKHTDFDIAVNELSIGYSKKKKTSVVASNINFNVNQGQLLGIVGINGIGKTTLLRTLGGIQNALSGEILLYGKEVNSYHPKNLSTLLSVVLTDPLVTKNLTVFELISLGRQPYTNWLGGLTAADIQVVQDVLMRLKINELAHLKCYELSDGQLQKVLLGRALAQDTPVVLLDEPTTHLDLFHKVQILKLLRQIAHDLNKLVIFSTHEIELAIQLCDTIALLHHKGCDYGTPKELIAQGKFQALFPEDTLTFDPSSGSFLIRGS